MERHTLSSIPCLPLPAVLYVVIEVGSICTAQCWIFRDSVATAVSVAERPRSTAFLQLPRRCLLCHRRCREFCRLLLQGPRHQPATPGPDPMVHTGPCVGTGLLQQLSDRGGRGYSRTTGRDDVRRSAAVLYARRSSVYREILVRQLRHRPVQLAVVAAVHKYKVLLELLFQVIGTSFSTFMSGVKECVYRL